MTIFVTGGAGFIGAAVVRQIIERTNHAVINVDKMTYAADLNRLDSVNDCDRYCLERVDVGDREKLTALFRRHQPEGVIHLAAESHVDRSIDGPAAFMSTNILGTFALLETAYAYWQEVGQPREFRFHHVSTDEVYGSTDKDHLFDEACPYKPSSPYAASKASADHLVRAWHTTYKLPIVMTNGSNTYGPYQFPEKFIPLMIVKGSLGEPMPVYGDGQNVRDWIHVDDHAAAIWHVFERGDNGQTYNIGGRTTPTNLDVVNHICQLLDIHHSTRNRRPHDKLITLVTDRPGHDAAYAVDPTKLETTLGWTRHHSFDEGLKATVDWYLENHHWWQAILDQRYSGERLGRGHILEQVS